MFLEYFKVYGPVPTFVSNKVCVNFFVCLNTLKAYKGIDVPIQTFIISE
jgi:hypothetical protein